MDGKSALTTAYRIRTGHFEGPLDLLFHLIEKNKINIYDIPISEITEQYMDYLFDMKKIDLDIASEFFLMASCLLHIKSSMLIPSKLKGEQNEEGPDPREELKERLLQYKKYKNLSLYLKQEEEKWSYVYYKVPEHITIGPANENLLVSSDTLINVYKGLLLKNKNKKNTRTGEIVQLVQRENITIRNKIRQLRKILLDKSKFVFNEIFSPEKKSLTEVVTAFLALLVLTKTGKIDVWQKNTFTDIHVENNKAKTFNKENREDW